MQCKSEPSPLAQGTLSEHCSHLVRPRFIPACAGNSFATLPSIFERPVHPRLRGELINRYKQQVRFNGSSPLTRGTLTNISGKINFIRFIPAYAGNSITLQIFRDRRSVHPRLRGELLIHTGKIQAPIGSSPLTRGTRGRAQKRIAQCRFIPAYAGNSLKMVTTLH